MSSSASVSSSSTVISVDGREKCCAINVGTNAERITTVTSSVNWTAVIRWFVRPYSAAIEPKVKPVAVSKVVYVRSRLGSRKYVEVGRTPTNLVIILTAKSAPITPAPVTSADAEMSVPTRKKNDARDAKAMVRILSKMMRSIMKTPATTSPARYASRTASLPASVASSPSASRATKINLNTQRKFSHAARLYRPGATRRVTEPPVGCLSVCHVVKYDFEPNKRANEALLNHGAFFQMHMPFDSWDSRGQTITFV